MFEKILRLARPFIIMTGIVLLFAASFYIVDAVSKKKEPQPAPEITGVAYDETSLYSLSDHRGQKGTILTFFDPAQEDTVTLLETLIAANRGRVEILAVSVSALPIAEQKAFLSSVESGCRILFDVDGKMAETYGISGVPVTYFIDKNGLIQDAFLRGISAKTLEETIAAIA